MCIQSNLLALPPSEFFIISHSHNFAKGVHSIKQGLFDKNRFADTIKKM